jgi:CheY-like chemotaxis protein
MIAGGRGGDTEETAQHFAAGSRVLVAEDNPTNQIITVTLLRKLGLEPEVVANGAEAVAAIAGAPYDIVLMDMQMPGVDGVEATRRIRRLPAPHGHVPIIGVTANAFVEDHARCLEAGMQAVVTKPFRASDLSRVMAPHLTRAEATADDDPRIADPAAWTRLVHDVGTEAARAIMSVFLQDSRARLARINSHLATGDSHSIGREAHALKSSVDLLGFGRMTRFTALIQQRAREGADLREIEGLVRALVGAFSDVEALCLDRLETDE